MTYVSWNGNVNTKFFNVSEKIQDNAISTEYNSGRKATILKNTRFLKELSCSLCLNVKTGEYRAFNVWFTEVLGGLSGAFTCPILGDGYFRFKSSPSFDNGQVYKKVELELEEVY